jgi:hypothetical protein
MRFLSIVVGLGAALLVTTPSLAQSPSPETLAAARELVNATTPTDQMRALLPKAVEGMKPAMVRGRPAVERDFDAIAPGKLAAAYARLPELVEMVAQVYARIFTASELREIQAFYVTPTGQKLRQNLAVITKDTTALGQQFGKSLMADLYQQIADELRKRGHDIPVIPARPAQPPKPPTTAPTMSNTPSQ